jgi:N,N'-diacetyllegionaminate synthase
MNNRVFIIAEAGVNHNGDLSRALSMIDAAVDAGADAIKFQTAIPELVVTAAAEKAHYQKETTGAQESQLEMIRKITLPLQAFTELQSYAKRRGIIFFSTAFDLVSLAYLAKLDMPLQKIPSGEITNLPYLKAIARLNKPTILSTGMATTDEIQNAYNILKQTNPSLKISLLHCNTEYPTPMQDVNLKAMLTLKNIFDVEVGYSDHTKGMEISIAAVALGAKIIEKHFTLDNTLVGPDHKASLEPQELKALVSAIRNVELALMGDGKKQPSESEKKNISIARRSIVANKAIKKGELFTEDNLIAKRPANGLSPMLWDKLIGKDADKDYAADEQISFVLED